MPPLSDLDTQKIVDYFKDRHIPSGLGDKEEACSIAGINLALSGELTDEIPECMSLVIGKWIIAIQDGMPDAMRNSTEWKALLPLAAGTGREHEAERAAIVLDWMWSVLAYLQPLADAKGFGDAWRTMCIVKTASAATAVAEECVATAKWAADIAEVAGRGSKKAWTAFDPCALLARLIQVDAGNRVHTLLHETA